MPSSPCFFRKVGPVDQSGMIAAFATRKSRVQIPLGPLYLNPVDFGKASLILFGSLRKGVMLQLRLRARARRIISKKA